MTVQEVTVGMRTGHEVPRTDRPQEWPECHQCIRRSLRMPFIVPRPFYSKARTSSISVTRIFSMLQSTHRVRAFRRIRRRRSRMPAWTMDVPMAVSCPMLGSRWAEVCLECHAAIPCRYGGRGQWRWRLCVSPRSDIPARTKVAAGSGSPWRVAFGSCLVGRASRADLIYFRKGGEVQLPATVEGNRVVLAMPEGKVELLREDIVKLVPGFWPGAEWEARRREARTARIRGAVCGRVVGDRKRADEGSRRRAARAARDGPEARADGPDGRRAGPARPAVR